MLHFFQPLSLRLPLSLAPSSERRVWSLERLSHRASACSLCALFISSVPQLRIFLSLSHSGGDHTVHLTFDFNSSLVWVLPTCSFLPDQNSLQVPLCKSDYNTPRKSTHHPFAIIPFHCTEFFHHARANWPLIV